MFANQELTVAAKVRIASTLGELKGRLAGLDAVERGAVVFSLCTGELVELRGIAEAGDRLEEWRRVTRRILEVFHVVLESDDAAAIERAVQAILFPGGRRDDPTASTPAREVM